MNEVIGTLASAGLWIGAVVGAVAGLLLQLLWNKRSPQLSAARARMRVAAENRRGRVAIGGSLPVPGDVLPDYFRRQEERVDLAIYELSLRPDVPVMDMLYFEYLRARLSNDSIGQVVIVPWSGWRDERNNEGERAIVTRLEEVFRPFRDRVTIVTAEMLQEDAGTVFQNAFFEQVGNLGNSEFLRTASSLMGYRFRSFHDINQGHPETHQARSIVEHTVRGWLIYRYVERAHIATPSPPKKIASIMWERELTKLLLLSNIVSNHDDIECSLILGGSVTYRRGLRKVPLPTFAHGSLSIFGDEAGRSASIAGRSRAELRKTNEVLAGILASHGGLKNLSGWTASPRVEGLEDGLRGDALALSRSLRRTRALYARVQ